MLHAFETDVNNNPYVQTAGIATLTTTDDTFSGNNVGNGVERWAYIPRMVLPQLWHIGASNSAHRYYTDGSPRLFDICISCLLYTSDAADERSSVDLGGRRI